MIALNVAAVFLAYLFGWAIYDRLHRRQYPSSAARFGCFWFFAILVLANLLLLPFTVKIHIPTLVFIVVIAVLAIWLIVIYQKKR